MPALKSISALILAVPLLAQSPQIAQRIRDSAGSSYLLHAGESRGALYDGLQALLREDGLVDMGIVFGASLPASPTHQQLAADLRLRPDSTWALADGQGYTLLQGNALPTVEELINALDKAGVRSPIRTLRDFLRQNPDHLDAREHLLARLRAVSENRTRQTLQLDVLPPREMARRGGFDSDGWYRILSRNAAVDTSQLDGKMLSPEQDIHIWGAYAQELHTLFESGGWRLLPSMLNTAQQIPAEACSPMMVQLYRRNLSKVEAYLEECPSDILLWRFYGWMLSIAKQGSAWNTFNSLLPSPLRAPEWPNEEAMSLLIAEARQRGNWNATAEVFWQSRHRIRPLSAVSLEHAQHFTGVQAAGMTEVMWRDELEPLLESLIRANRIGDAESVLMEVIKIKAYSDFQRRAAELAQSMGRSDLQAKWMALQVYENLKEEPDIEDYLKAYLLPESKSSLPSLIVIHGEEYQNQVEEMLNYGALLEWGMPSYFFSLQLSDLLQQREGWPVGETHWALFDGQGKMLGSGPGLPAAESLYSIMEPLGVEPRAKTLSRFISERPMHMEAKENLLGELKRVAEQKTRQALGEAAGRDAAQMLSDAEDYAIWGEYASLYRQMLPYFLEQSRPLSSWFSSSCESGYFIHSQIMKTASHSLLHQAEASLHRQPASEFLWGAWASLAYLAEHRKFADIKNSLALSPMSSPLNLPPHSVRGILLERLQSRADWQEVAELQEWRWEMAREDMERTSADSRGFPPSDMLSLLEAYLRLEKNREANELIRVWSKMPGWGESKQACADLAEKCGRPDLAEQWKRL